MALPMMAKIAFRIIIEYNLPSNLHCHTAFPFANGNSLLIADAQSAGVFDRLNEESGGIKKKAIAGKLKNKWVRAEAPDPLVLSFASALHIIFDFFSRPFTSAERYSGT
jgi:hypothetical protein